MSSCAVPGQKRRLFKDAGRACPVDYRIPDDAFAGEPQRDADVLYVVGGLYGNPFALDALDKLVAAERDGKRVLSVFNGDMHWFDKTAENFATLERRVQAEAGYIPLVGNVEAELRRQTDVGVGCGCAYPECTSDEAVSRSNRIHKMLSIAVDEHPDLKGMLVGRPATMTVGVAGRKIAITHGDEKLIGGWDCSRESLQDVMRQDEVDTFMERNDVDVFVTTHTCAPVALRLARGVIVNNGAAGLPNFEGQHYGLVIRVAEEPVRDAVFECEQDGVWVQAVPLRYDHDAYVAWFDGLWNETSPAAVSYRERIIDGPDDRLADSLLGGVGAGATAREEDAARRKAASAALADAEASTGDSARGRGRREKATDRDVALGLAKVLYFEDMVDDAGLLETVKNPSTIQLNITARCNLACRHCHVKSSPARTEVASSEVLRAVIDVAQAHGIQTIDITGGAPEMHPDFEAFLRRAARAVPHVMVRTNLVVLEDPLLAHLAEVYAELCVEVVASLPNVFAAQADAQRGRDVYDGSLRVLRRLNALGYGTDGRHVLDLVFNPQEPVLPPLQDDLEEMYKRRLSSLGVTFDNLFAVANMPIGRYGASLIDSGAFDGYVDTLIDAFNADAVPNMMCRHQLSVGWDGSVYDCDFNQALGLRARRSDGSPVTILDYAADPTMSLARPVTVGNHCYACTAGFGSSCGGTLVQG